MSRGIIKQALVAVFGMGFMCGCATTHMNMEPKVANEIRSINIVSIIEQDKVEIEVKRSKGGQAFGLLGALIDSGVTSSRKSDAEDLVFKLRAQLRAEGQTFVFRDEFWASLDSLFTHAEWPSEFTLERHSKKVGEYEIQKLISESPRDATLVLRTRYFLTPSVTVLAIATHADAYLHDSSTRIYYGDYTYLSDRINADESGIKKEVAVDQWASQGAQEFLKGVREGIAENIKMLRHDLIHRDSTPPPSAEWLKLEYEDPYGVDDKVKAEAVLLGRLNGRAFLRNKKGNLFSMPEHWIEAFAAENSATTKRD